MKNMNKNQSKEQSYEERFKEEFVSGFHSFHCQMVEEVIREVEKEKKDKILEYSHTEARCLAVGFNEGLFKAIEIIKSKLL